MLNTSSPSICGIFKSHNSTRNGCASRSDNARMPDDAVWMSGLLGSCVRNSLHSSSQSLSSSNTRILCRVSIPMHHR